MNLRDKWGSVAAVMHESGFAIEGGSRTPYRVTDGGETLFSAHTRSECESFVLAYVADRAGMVVAI